MTRLEALKWCWDNLSNVNNRLSWKEIENVIGGVYLEELKYMGFISRWFNWQESRYYTYLTQLGKLYCKELFD